MGQVTRRDGNDFTNDQTPGPVAVTGMHRTGTSMIARVLRLGGLWLGRDEDMIAPAPDNPEGFFEHAGIVRVNEELLEATGGAWDRPPQAGPVAADDPRVEGVCEAARKVLVDLSSSQPWGWKDPRSSLTAAFWLDLLPDLRFVVCVRHPLEVALSLKRRNQISYSLALSLWERYYATVLDLVAPHQRLVTHFEAHFDEERRELDRLLTFVGLPDDVATAARSGIRRGLRHHRPGISLSDAGVSAKTIALYRRLCDEARWTVDFDDGAPAGPTVHRAVLDLAATRELAAKQDGHIAWLEDKVRGLEREKETMANAKDREVESLRREVGGLENEKSSLAGRLTASEAEKSSLAERLVADERFDLVQGRLEAFEAVLSETLNRLDARSPEYSAEVTACREVVRTHVPLDAPVLVVGKSDPAFETLCGRAVSNFPQDRLGRYPGFALSNGESAIAHLEALRAGGKRFLLVPMSSRWWLDRYPSLGEHVVNRYRVVASNPTCGLLVDVSRRRAPAGGWPLAVSDAIGRLARAMGRSMVALDWTDLDMATELPALNVFSPGEPGEQLPYLEGTIDVVMITEPDRIPEARRVGRVAVILVRRTEGGHPEVTSVETLCGEHPLARRRTAVLPTSEVRDVQWHAYLAEALEEEHDWAELAGLDADLGQTDVIALVDEGVLPLPGCLLAARTALERDARVGAVAVKVYAPDGSLEAAGTTVFSDGSDAGIAAGSFDVSAEWHEFARDTCWGPGLMLFRSSALQQIDRSAPAGGVHAAWSARLWAAGFRVLYHPTAAAVRTAPRADADEDAVRAIWNSVPLRHPAKPLVIDEAAWRTLLVEDELSEGVR